MEDNSLGICTYKQLGHYEFSDSHLFVLVTIEFYRSKATPVVERVKSKIKKSHHCYIILNMRTIHLRRLISSTLVLTIYNIDLGQVVLSIGTMFKPVTILIHAINALEKGNYCENFHIVDCS